MSPTGRESLKSISLGFYLGAKVGILGANGSGKSTLMKILAGVKKDSDAEYYVDSNVKIGYLAQVQGSFCAGADFK